MTKMKYFYILYLRLWQSCCLQHVCIPGKRSCKQQQDIATCPVLVLWGNPSQRSWHEMDLAAPCMLLPEIAGELQWVPWADGDTHMLPTASEESTFGNSLLVGTIHQCCQLRTVSNHTFRSQLITCRQPSAAKEIHWRQTYANKHT